MTELFESLHESCIRRKLARASRENLDYRTGVSDELIRAFYKLTVLTRRRHGVPAPPLSWFRNLVASNGERILIRVAEWDHQPIAGMVTLRYKSTMTYKYGASDARFHRLGAIAFLMWKAIEEAHGAGLQSLDMGRTEWTNEGLLAFKDRWGATRSPLTYWRYPKVKAPAESITARFARRCFSAIPEHLIGPAASRMYRHIG